jgi:hypothetical protein
MTIFGAICIFLFLASVLYIAGDGRNVR